MRILLTGSHVYGPVHEDSDIDIVLHVEDAGKLKEELVKKNIELFRSEKQQGTDYPGYYFRFGELTINIIYARDEDEMAGWAYATKKLSLMEPIEDKEEKIRIFEEARKGGNKNGCG